MSKWDNPLDGKLADIFDALERQRVRDQRNTRHILKVLRFQNEKLDRLLAGTQSKGILTFGKPQPKPAKGG